MRPNLTCSLFFGALIAVMMCGCGGGGGSQWPITGSGRLQAGDLTASDGSYGDYVVFTAPHNGEVTVEMDSETLDPYITVYNGISDSKVKLGSDDDSGDGLNASYTFYASGGTTYTVWMTTYSDGAVSGNYTYVMHDANRSSQIPDLVSSGKPTDRNPRSEERAQGQ